MKYQTGAWTLKELNDGKVGLPKNNLRVFSCFSCGGGSSMGYKLAGYTVEGFCEIDPKMAECYQANMKVKHPYIMPIQDFNKLLEKDGVPKWLKGIDILDGSPPCSSFSMAGNREKDWGKKKKFREGQADQVLDDLFFHFIKTAELVKPKVIIAENVKGMLAGEARAYVAEIFLRLKKLGYTAKLFLLDSSLMGIPQRRQRVFFIATKDCNNLSLSFNETVIPISKAILGIGGERKPLSEAFAKWWRRTPPGHSLSFSHPKGSFFNSIKLHPQKPAPTLTASGGAKLSHWENPESFSDLEYTIIQSFPLDYNFCGMDSKYICGMSVPPLMTQRVAGEVYKQCFASFTKSTPNLCQT